MHSREVRVGVTRVTASGMRASESQYGKAAVILTLYASPVNVSVVLGPEEAASVVDALQAAIGFAGEDE